MDFRMWAAYRRARTRIYFGRRLHVQDAVAQYRKPFKTGLCMHHHSAPHCGLAVQGTLQFWSVPRMSFLKGTHAHATS